MELCGGENWQLGYCAQGLTCTALNHTGIVTVPDIGVCKGECEKDLKQFGILYICNIQIFVKMSAFYNS